MIFPGCGCIAPVTRWISDLRLEIFSGLFVLTRDFTKPQRKKGAPVRLKIRRSLRAITPNKLSKFLN